MPKTAARKLTSEELCEKAFEHSDWPKLLEPNDRSLAWAVWQDCWKFLQVTLKEYIES